MTLEDAYLCYRPALTHFAARRCPGEAEDIVQDAFLRLVHHLHRLATPEHVRNWLYKVVLNLCRDRYRRRGTIRLVGLTPSASLSHPIEADACDREQLREVGQALRSLHPVDQQTLLLVWLGYTRHEAGILTHRSSYSAAKSSAYRARQAFHAAYAAAGGS